MLRSALHVDDIAIEGAAVFGHPTDGDFLPAAENFVSVNVWNFDDEVVAIDDFHSGTDVVAEIDEFFDAAFEDAEIIAADVSVGVDDDAFRSDGQDGVGVFALDVYGLCAGGESSGELDGCDAIGDLSDAPAQGVIFADELGDEGCEGFFVGFDGCGELLDDSVVKDGDAVGHG